MGERNEAEIYELTTKIDNLRQKNNELMQLLVVATLKAGFRYDSKEYKQAVSLVGQKRIALAKIEHGYALTDKEKEYITNNLI